MKRIALVVWNLMGGGAERVVLNIANMYQKRGIFIDIFIFDDRIDYDILGLTVHKILLPKDQKSVFKGIERKKRALLLEEKILELEDNGEKFDLIFSNLPFSDHIVNLISSLKNKVYYIIHLTYSKELEELRRKSNIIRAYRRKKIYQNLYKNKKIICVSLGTYEDILSIDIKPKIAKIIYNPFDINKIRIDGNIKYDDIPQEKYIIHVGAYRKEKRHDILLEAYAKLINPPKLYLLCSHTLELENLIKYWDLENRVVIFGFKQNPYPYIKNAKLLILSSDRESLSMVIVESIILKTPVVSTNCVSGPSEILQGELSQYLAKVNDCSDLSIKIQMALDTYPNIDDSYIEKFKEENIYNEYRKLLKKGE